MPATPSRSSSSTMAALSSADPPRAAISPSLRTTSCTSAVAGSCDRPRRDRRVDPQWLDLIKIIVPVGLSGGGGLGFYLLYRKFEAERLASLREDNKTLREER